MINNKRISQTEHLNWFINLSKSNFFHNYAFINRNKIYWIGIWIELQRKKVNIVIGDIRP